MICVSTTYAEIKLIDIETLMSTFDLREKRSNLLPCPLITNRWLLNSSPADCHGTWLQSSKD